MPKGGHERGAQKGHRTKREHTKREPLQQKLNEIRESAQMRHVNNPPQDMILGEFMPIAGYCHA